MLQNVGLAYVKLRLGEDLGVRLDEFLSVSTLLSRQIIRQAISEALHVIVVTCGRLHGGYGQQLTLLSLSTAMKASRPTWVVGDTSAEG